MSITLPALSLALLQLPIPQGRVGQALMLLLVIAVVIVVGREIGRASCRERV